MNKEQILTIMSFEQQIYIRYKLFGQFKLIIFKLYVYRYEGPCIQVIHNVLNNIDDLFDTCILNLVMTLGLLPFVIPKILTLAYRS